MTPFAKQMPNLNLMLNLKIASDVDVLVTKDGQTMAEMKTAHRSVFVRADLRAHLFGFILTSPDKHAWSCLDRIHPVPAYALFFAPPPVGGIIFGIKNKNQEIYF